MQFERLTLEEEKKIEVFLELWKERCITTIFVNHLVDGTCIGKLNDKWVKFYHARNTIYSLEEYESLDSLIDHYFIVLGKRNEEYFRKEYPLRLNDALEGKIRPKDKYIKYSELTDEEKTILIAFIKLLREKGDYERNIYYPSEKTVDRWEETLQFYKKGNKWILYVLERNIKSGFREYDDLYSLCIDAFDSFEKEHTDYYMDVFPVLIEDILKSKQKTIKQG